MQIYPRYQNPLPDPKLEKVINNMHILAAAGVVIKANIDSKGFSVCVRLNSNTSSTVTGLDSKKAMKLYASLCKVHPVRGKHITRPVTDSEIRKVETELQLIWDKGKSVKSKQNHSL